MLEKVSIIVPAYNCANQIRHCIDSLINQTYKNIEIIVINDGSTDNLNMIVDEYSDNRIKYYEQDNSGPSSARNKGIKYSNGEYIVFVDADDRVNKSFIEYLLNSIKKNKSDIACCGYIYEDNEKNVQLKLNEFLSMNVNTSKENFIDCVLSGLGGVLWNKIFRKDIIEKNRITMDESIFMCEDLLFILEYLKYSEKVSIIDKYLYIYNAMNEGSISFKANSRYLKNNIVVIKRIKSELLKLNISNNKIDSIISTRIYNMINNLLKKESNFTSRKDIENSIKVFKDTIDDEFVCFYLRNIEAATILDILIIGLIKNKKIKEILYFYKYCRKIYKLKKFIK